MHPTRIPLMLISFEHMPMRRAKPPASSSVVRVSFMLPRPTPEPRSDGAPGIAPPRSLRRPAPGRARRHSLALSDLPSCPRAAAYSQRPRPYLGRRGFPDFTALGPDDPPGSVDADTAAWLVTALSDARPRSATAIIRAILSEARHVDDALLVFGRR